MSSTLGNSESPSKDTSSTRPSAEDIRLYLKGQKDEWPEGEVLDTDGRPIGKNEVCKTTDYFVVVCLCMRCRHRRGEAVIK